MVYGIEVWIYDSWFDNLLRELLLGSVFSVDILDKGIIYILEMI